MSMYRLPVNLNLISILKKVGSHYIFFPPTVISTPKLRPMTNSQLVFWIRHIISLLLN